MYGELSDEDGDKHNSVPEPVIHRIAQRTGTNVLELDFEVTDTDDDNEPWELLPTVDRTNCTAGMVEWHG